LRSVAHGFELQLEELLHHVELSEIPINPARGRETLGERGVQLVRVLIMFERLDAREKLVLENATETKVKLRLRGIGPSAGNSFFQLLDQPLPITNGLEIRKSLLQIH